MSKEQRNRRSDGEKENAMYDKVPGLIRHSLDEAHVCYLGEIPGNLLPNESELNELWEMHPSEYPQIMMHGHMVSIPRWQQAYGADYRFSGQVSKALPVPQLLRPLLSWVQETIDSRCNGLLLNWYDAERRHYIGAHRDKAGDLWPDSPIVMVSLGAERTMRLRRYKDKDRHDFVVSNGTMCILPLDTNQAWTHEVLHRKGDGGRRISVTIRAFKTAAVDESLVTPSNSNRTEGQS
jgi:alkylated DNA repair dioxygenase AlkB